MRIVRLAAACVAALALSGCLVSEEPLLSDANAGAAPIAPGRYQACGESDDCKALRVSVEGGVYTFEPEAEDASLGRFRPLGRDAYLAQMWEDGDHSYFYFYAVKTKTGAKLSMVSCADVSAATRARLTKSGDLAVSGDGTTCTAKTLKGAERAARDYGRRLGKDADWTVLTRKDD